MLSSIKKYTLFLSALVAVNTVYAERVLELNGGGFVELDNEVIVINLPEKYRFEFDRHNILQVDTTDSLEDFLKRYSGSYLLRVAGHTDSKGSDEYNFKLGMKRADSLVSEFSERGFSSDRFESSSFGSSDPFYFGAGAVADDVADRENRRLELMLQNTKQ